MRGMAKTDRGDSSFSQMPGCGPKKKKYSEILLDLVKLSVWPNSKRNK